MENLLDSLNKILIRLKEEWIKNRTPNVSKETGEFLESFIQKNWYTDILEIGTANGYSTLYLIRSILEKNGHVLTVEVQRNAYLEAKENLKLFTKNVTLVRSDALDFIRALEDFTFDFIFIDAGKIETLKYFLWLRKHLRSTGTIIVDDVVKFRYKMEDFYEYLEKEKIVYEIVMTDPDDGIMIIPYESLEKPTISL